MNRRIPLFFAGLLLGIVTVLPLHAQSQDSSNSLGKAEINRIINDVFTIEDIRKEKPPVHPSSEGEVIGQYHALRTAQESRAELKFSDGSLARIGSDAFFSFSADERDVQMGKGTALFQVPKGSKETNVRTATATASLTGTTLMVNQQPDQHVKAAVIEGSVDVSMPERVGESRSLQAGEMLVMPTDAERLPEPVDVDLQELVSTSGLINNFDEEEDEQESTDESQGTDESSDETATQEEGAAEETDATSSPDDEPAEQDDGESSLDYDQMSEGIEQQKEEIESGELEETNMVIEGDGTEMTLVESEDEADQTANTADQDDAVEQKNESSQTFTLDDDSEIYLGTGESDPPTADSREGEIFTPPSPDDSTSGSMNFSSTNVDDFLGRMSRGADVARFDFDEVVIGGSPQIQTTDQVFNLAAVSESSLSLDADALTNITANNGLQSISLVAKGDDYQWDIPEIDSEGVGIGLLANGTGSEIQLSSVLVQGNQFTAGSYADLTANNISLGASEIKLGSALGTLEVGSSTLTSDFFTALESGKTDGPSVQITDSTELRMLSTSGEIGIRTHGGDIEIGNSKVGYYGSTNELTNGGGYIFIDTLNPDVNGSVRLTDSTLKAESISTAVRGPEGQLLINGSTLSAAATLDLYASGSNGIIRFTGNSTLGSSTASKNISAKTVRIDPNVNVKVIGAGSNLGVAVDNKEYSEDATVRSCGSSNCGYFVDGAGTPIPVPSASFSN